MCETPHNHPEKKNFKIWFNYCSSLNCASTSMMSALQHSQVIVKKGKAVKVGTDFISVIQVNNRFGVLPKGHQLWKIVLSLTQQVWVWTMVLNHLFAHCPALWWIEWTGWSSQKEEAQCLWRSTLKMSINGAWTTICCSVWDRKSLLHILDSVLPFGLR